MSAETIFFIILLIFFFVVQGAAKRKEADRRQPGSTRPRLPRSVPAASTEWEDALREIHEKLALPTREPVPASPPTPTRLEVQRTKLEQLGTEQEKRKALAVRLEGALGRGPRGEQPGRAPVKLDPVTPSVSHIRPIQTADNDDRGQDSNAAREIRELLRRPGGIRNTIILAELLGPPRSRHRR